MLEYGEVVEINGNTAKVKFTRSSACGKCNACGLSANKQTITVETPNSLNAQVGDEVLVEIDTSVSLKASAIAYIFPLCMLILGIILGSLFLQIVNIQNTDFVLASFGVVFAALGLILLKPVDNIMKKRLTNIYKMIEIKK